MVIEGDAVARKARRLERACERINVDEKTKNGIQTIGERVIREQRDRTRFFEFVNNWIQTDGKQNVTDAKLRRAAQAFEDDREYVDEITGKDYVLLAKVDGEGGIREIKEAGKRNGWGEGKTNSTLKQYMTIGNYNTGIKLKHDGKINTNAGIKDGIRKHRGVKMSGSTANRIAKSAGGGSNNLLRNLSKIK